MSCIENVKTSPESTQIKRRTVKRGVRSRGYTWQARAGGGGRRKVAGPRLSLQDLVPARGLRRLRARESPSRARTADFPPPSRGQGERRELVGSPPRDPFKGWRAKAGHAERGGESGVEFPPAAPRRALPLPSSPTPGKALQAPHVP